MLSLGNTMKSGCVHDSMDAPQEREIEMNADLAKRANQLGVQSSLMEWEGMLAPRRYLAI
jgi:thiamine biosynthesis protein ThiC